MATVIRLKRGGRRHAPYYRVVVMDSRTRQRGREVEQIGLYHPCARPDPRTEINVAKALKWLAVGAQPTVTVRDILSKKGVLAAFAAGKTAAAAEAEAAAAEAAAATEEALPASPEAEAPPEPTEPTEPEAQDQPADETPEGEVTE